MVYGFLSNLLIKSSKISNIDSNIDYDYDSVLSPCYDETYCYEMNDKTKKIFGCDIYDSNPPLCCRMMKRLGVHYMLKCYFMKRMNKINNYIEEQLP
jgi:hypothetical protein